MVKFQALFLVELQKKLKTILQIGNKIHVNFNSKNDNKLGYFKVEIQQALSPLYFDNQKKLSCITSAMNLIKILTAENQKNINIYELIKDFYLFLDKDNWIKRYIFWELELFRVLGYDLELKNLVDKEVVGDKLQYISKSNTNKKIIPNFLIEKNEEPVDLTNLKKGLFLIGDYLEKTILKPNNLSQPISRLNFINSLK